MPDVIEISFRSRAEGPISSGRIHAHAFDYAEDVAEKLAEEGKDLLLQRFHLTFRNPTGYYESRIDTRPVGVHRYEVHDSGVVYGPWLEGTGSRNSPVTVFPGYHGFQIAEMQLKRKRSNIARRTLRAHRARGRLI